jgi:hypothetical protein
MHLKAEYNKYKPGARCDIGMSQFEGLNICNSPGALAARNISALTLRVEAWSKELTNES